jgi:hypothetical protein
MVTRSSSGTFITLGSAQPRYEGDYYRLLGAKRGPAPAHGVPVGWVRTSRGCCGWWLPSLSYLKAGDLRAGNEVIDEAARRNPLEIRRLLNVFGRRGSGGVGSCFRSYSKTGLGL